MTIETVLASVQFASTGPGQVSLDDRNSINNAIVTLYASPTARSILETASRRGLLSFQTNPAQENVASSPINLNFGQIANLAWFNSEGTLVSASLDLVIIHELKHAVSPDGAPDPGYPLTIVPSATVNQADWVTDGPAVRAQNAAARELGRAGEIRISYHGSIYIDKPGQVLVLGQNYTDGATIDSVRIAAEEDGGSGGRDMDERAHSTKLRNLIFGAGSDDIINAAAGNDWVYGGAGGDTINGGFGGDKIWGDDRFDFTVVGDDIIDGGAGADTIVGGPSSANGVDDIRGGDNNDTIYGDFGVNGPSTIDLSLGYKDIISGGLGADFINGQQGDDVINGNEGTDTLIGGDGNDEISGGANDDIISGDDGQDTIYGDGGLDTIYGGSGEDTIDGGAGDDSIYGDSENDFIRGGGGIDTIFGGTGDDLIAGNANTDFLYGEDGDDSIVGGGGSDELYSGSGLNNGLFGEDGDDRLVFDSGGGVADGGTGTDTILVQSGRNVSIEGGKGNDIIDARGAAGYVNTIWNAGDGYDTIKASYSVDITTLTYSNVYSILNSVSDPRGIRRITFQGQSINNYKLVWSASLINAEPIPGDNRSNYLYGGNMQVVDKATGLTGFDLGVVLGTSPYLDPNFSTLYLRFLDMPSLAFDDAFYNDSGEGSDNITLEIVAPSNLAAFSISAPTLIDATGKGSASVESSERDLPFSASAFALSTLADIRSQNGVQSLISTDAFKSAQQLAQAMSGFGIASAGDLAMPKVDALEFDAVFTVSRPLRGYSLESMALA